MVAVSLTPPVLDLLGVRAGDRNQLTVRVTSGGAPVSLVGQVVQAQARKNATDADPPALTAVITVTDAPGGVFTMRWDGAAVRTLLGTDASWSGKWDLQIGPSGGDPTTIAAGAFQAESDVTR